MARFEIDKYTMRGFFFPAVTASLLFLTGIYLQPFGFVLSIFSPLPIVFTYLQNGKKAGIYILAAITGIICLAGNFKYGALFFLEYGIMAVIIGETIKRHYTVEKIIISSVFISLCAGGMVLMIYSILEGSNPHAVLSEQVSKSLNQTIEMYQESGMSKDNMMAIKKYSETIVSAFINSFPAWIVASSVVGALLNYLATKSIWLKYKGNGYFNTDSLTCWRSPDYFVWILIGGGVMTIAPVNILKNIGLNILILMVLLYGLQGLAIVNFYLIKIKIPLFLKIIANMLLITQFVFIIIIVGAGVFDLWLNFRKLGNSVDGGISAKLK